MKEKTDLDVGFGISNLFPEHGRQEHQMIVVNPDQIAVFYIFCDSFSEEAVRFSVCVPSGFIKGYFAGMVME